MLTPSEYAQIPDNAEGRAWMRKYKAYCEKPVNQFRPRPDDPAEFEEQTAFCNATDKFAICLGGTGSGKTITAAVKTARKVLEEPPPRPECPFWIVGESYALVGGVCWLEKLKHLIPPHRIAWTTWLQRARQWPAAVGIRDREDPSKVSWILEFKSYSQGIEQFVSASIGGYWCNEEVTLEIVEEIQGRCRDYGSPGWADFTPLTVDSADWPRIYDACQARDTTSKYYREGWRFYHLNSTKNHYLAEGWAKSYLANVDEEMRQTRQVGVFASFRGKVFKNWRYKVNVIEEAVKNGVLHAPVPHPFWRCIRGLDWGYVNPLACLWIAVDRDGRYYVYDEHYAAGMATPQHVAEINKREWDVRNPKFGWTYYDSADPGEAANFRAANCKGFERQLGHVGPGLKIGPGAGARWLNELMRPDGSGKPRLFVSARCVNFIREIEGYKYPEGTAMHDANEDPIDKDNHAISAGIYSMLTDARSIGLGPSTGRREWEPRKSMSYGGGAAGVGGSR